jgi:16S rRNA (adenine1518-N6/adenine1519-N6)-dimethyltransferase
LDRVRSIALLRAHGLTPKKSFGQCFLDDPRLASQIAELTVPDGAGTVLEIGAGVGALSLYLAKRAARLVAVERDRDLVPLLRAVLASGEADGEEVSAIDIVEADAARLDWLAALAAGPRPWRIAGNLPYQITGALLERATGVARDVERAVFMIQREVAQRLHATPGTKSYGALSVFVQAAFAVKVALRVPAGAFTPAPKVDSAVVVLVPHAVPRAVETDAFRRVVHAAFATRRKTLRNAWARLATPELGLHDLAAAAAIDLGARGETLAVEDFARAAQVVAEHEPR